MADTSAARPLRSLVTVCACILGILIIACLALAREVLLPLALAVLVSFILTPLVVRLQRRGLGRVPSVLLVSTLALAVVVGFGAIIVLQLRSLVNDLPVYRNNIKHKVASLTTVGPGGLVEKIQNAVNDIHDDLTRESQAAAPAAQPRLVQVQPSGPARLQAILSPTLSLLAQFALVSILIVFMLAKHEDVRDRLIRLAGHGRLTDTTRALEEAGRRVSRYLSMQLIINTCFGLMMGLGLFLIGVPQALLWGLLVGALRFVPYLGSPVGALMLVALSVAIFPDWVQPLEVFALFAVLEVVTANVLEPLLFGHSTGVSPLALLFAAAFWAWLWGPLGLLLSTPLTVCLVVLGRYVPGLEFLGILLSDEPALTPEKRYYQRLLAHDPDEAIDLVEELLKTHPRDTLYDEVLLPSLVMAKRDCEHDVLGRTDKEAMLRDMRQILEEIVTVRCPPAAAGCTESSCPPVVLGVPADGHADELGLLMLRNLLEAEGCGLEVLPAGILAVEVLARIEEVHPAGVFITTLPPAGLADTRYLCKRLRSHLPDLKILVGRWGQKEDTEQTRARLQAAGANTVGLTLLESRVQILPLLKEDTEPRPRKPTPSTASA